MTKMLVDKLAICGDVMSVIMLMGLLRRIRAMITSLPKCGTVMLVVPFHSFPCFNNLIVFVLPCKP